MKTILKITLLIGFLMAFCQCTDDSAPECGCESETVYSIPNQEFEDVYGVSLEEQMTGKLFFKHPDLVDDFFDYDEYNNRFWIAQLTPNCGNCRRVFIVCNENLIGKEYERLKQKGVYDSVQIQFSGDVKLKCIGPDIIQSDIHYRLIELEMKIR